MQLHAYNFRFSMNRFVLVCEQITVSIDVKIALGSIENVFYCTHGFGVKTECLLAFCKDLDTRFTEENPTRFLLFMEAMKGMGTREKSISHRFSVYSYRLRGFIENVCVCVRVFPQSISKRISAAYIVDCGQFDAIMPQGV